MTRAVLAHRVTGAGDPVLLLNGGLMTLAAWDEIAGPLAQAHAVVGCDFRGQLLSPGPPPARLEGHVGDLVALLDALALPDVHVVGTSFGGLVGVLLAALHPQRVASLCVVTAGTHVTDEMARAGRPLHEAVLHVLDGGDPGTVFDALLETTFSPAFRERCAELLRVRRGRFGLLPRAWFEGLLGLLGALDKLDLRPRLGDVRAPTLVVAAELDATFPLEQSRELAAGLRAARLEVVPGSGHALVAEQPAALLALVQGFLAAARREVASPGHVPDEAP